MPRGNFKYIIKDSENYFKIIIINIIYTVICDDDTHVTFCEEQNSKAS